MQRFRRSAPARLPWTRTPAVAVAAALAVAPHSGQSPLVAQQANPAPSPGDREVRVVPGERYRASGLTRFLNGDNHRSLWLEPLDVEVLDLDGFAGGLTPFQQGGNQSRTLHMAAPDGRVFIFRSTDKYVRQVLPEDLRRTWTEQLLQDHVSAFHPTAGLVVPRLHEALGLLAVPAELRVMPDHPRLGEFRGAFAGQLGVVVERPNEGEGDRPLYGGYSKIISTEELYDKLEEAPRHQVDAREYLAARLIDFLVGDTDRGRDQWRWARESGAAGYRWRPIARDRDWALVHADGALAVVGRTVFPKLVEFDNDIPDSEALTFADRELAPRLLSGLDRRQWLEVVDGVQAGLTDQVIGRAVARLPAEHGGEYARWLVEALKRRRAQLPGVATAFYERLATDVDIRATDAPDRAEIVRYADGSVAVTLLAPASELGPQADARSVVAVDRAGPRVVAASVEAAGPAGVEPDLRPYYHRLFLPSETDEVRVFLHGGDDVAVVRGEGPRAITVRLIGGGGDDRLHDEAGGRGRTALYDSRGDNVLQPGPRGRADTREYEEPAEPDGFLEYQLGRQRDGGSELAWFDPVIDYGEGAGLIVGGGPRWTEYGFRRHPYATHAAVTGLVGMRTGDLGVRARVERRLENSPVGVRLQARATQLEAIRFYGLGNGTIGLSDVAGLVRLDRIEMAPSVFAESERWEASLGPLVRWTRPEVPAGNPAAPDPMAPGDPLPTALAGWSTELGARAELLHRRLDHPRVPTRGWQAIVSAAGFPGPDLDPHGAARGEARGYLPVPVPDGGVLALRLGGSRTFGNAPIHDLAWIGGRTTLRGYRWHRFAGDAAVYGGAELRVPLMRANLGVARGRLGVLGLVDAGRVYLDGESPGGWHTGYGAGVYFQTLDTALNLVWAHGEEDRVYAGLGMPF